MKKLFIIILLLPVVFLLSGKEYNYLNPPTISVMDFEVSIEEPVITSANSAVTLDKNYYGRLINQTLVTVLIQKNNAMDIEIGTARYFPTLLKIYDKKYVETALDVNHFTAEDLYQKNENAFKYADLDFVVLGNVFETTRDQKYIGVNVRVLNTYRGEELFSYTGLIDIDMKNLYTECGRIAENIISDILKNYCSQFIVKETATVPYNTPYLLFCQSSQEKANDNLIINSNDTYKKNIYRNSFYWILPGSYLITVYSEINKTVRTIPFTIDPREIKLIELTEEHFKVETGSITITDIYPVDAYSFRIREKVKDAEYIWEIGKDLGSIIQDYRFTFNKGVFDSQAADETAPVWVYKPALNEILITGMALSKYSITVTPVAESISRESITGIVRISSRAIETSDPVEIDMGIENDVVLGIPDFNIKSLSEIDAFKQTRVTFLFNPAFTDERTELWVYGESSHGYLLLRDIEKLIIEDEYSEDEWKDLRGLRFEINREYRRYNVHLYGEEYLAANDKIIIVDFNTIKPDKPLLNLRTAAPGALEETKKKGFFDFLFPKKKEEVEE